MPKETDPKKKKYCLGPCQIVYGRCFLLGILRFEVLQVSLKSVAPSRLPHFCPWYYHLHSPDMQKLRIIQNQPIPQSSPLKCIYYNSYFLFIVKRTELKVSPKKAHGSILSFDEEDETWDPRTSKEYSWGPNLTSNLMLVFLLPLDVSNSRAGAILPPSLLLCFS